MKAGKVVSNATKMRYAVMEYACTEWVQGMECELTFSFELLQFCCLQFQCTFQQLHLVDFQERNMTFMLLNVQKCSNGFFHAHISGSRSSLGCGGLGSKRCCLIARSKK